MGRPRQFSRDEMMRLRTAGFSIQQIADRLDCSYKTVKNQIGGSNDDACALPERPIERLSAVDYLGTAHVTEPEDNEDLTQEDWQQISDACDRYLARVKADPARWGTIQRR